MRTIFTLFLSLFAIVAFAQGEGVEMADAMMQSGKIYVVIGVMLIILVGIVMYLTALDRRVGNMEKEVERNA